MGTTVTGKLHKPANEFQAGDSIGFGVRIGVKYYDRKTKANEWTNYSAVVFAKPGPQADFYRSALVSGSIVELTCESLKLDLYEGSNGPILTAEMNNARIGHIGTAGSGSPQAGQAQQSNQPPQAGDEDFDNDIPFN